MPPGELFRYLGISDFFVETARKLFCLVMALVSLSVLGSSKV